MKRLLNQLGEWFGFTRRERRATLILLLVILLVAAARYTVPDRPLPVMISMVTGPDTIAESNNNPDQLYAGGEEKSNGLKKETSKLQDGRKKILLLNINTCDSASLEALPGIGTVLSARIIRYRNLLGGYAFVDQLREVYGLSEETFRIIEKRVYADSLEIRKIRINEAEYRDLLRMPYLDKHEIAAILKYRELEGRLTCMDDLVSNRLIERITATKIRPYIDFGIE